MSKSDFHVQCRLFRINKDNFKETYTVYIPEKYAYYRNVIDIEIDGILEKGWIIVDTFDKLPSDVVNERSQDYKRTRKASDI